MAKTISCREVGLFTDCDALMRGDTDEEVLRAAAAHGKERHGMTDEELRDPSTQEQFRGFIREG